ncbi:MAG: LysM peptidoglycan-binding domain-containing protein [Spirochaetota bacterium]|nr:LysM peptidoglycan-binding domain-containing protein [Spirochaetota bacterium]
MAIQDLIKQDSDRLFIVDPECFIIFTGDSLQDDKPFIRIGTWINMPVISIPLIENIIIPDIVIGNPSYEQFNIDINTLSTNRYIGSRLIVKSYLNFQKMFDLNLENASIVDIEKDIPSLSKEKIISNRDSFIGIFYTNGNFKIVQNGNTIFDLNEIEEKSFSDIYIHNEISMQNKRTNRYVSAGLVLLNENPIFYNNRYFTSYLFPNNYYEEFSSLDIDPAKVREILLPGLNIMSITKFVKWKNSLKSGIKIFSDFKDRINYLQKLFPDSRIIRKNFNGLSLDTGDGLTITNYPGTLNLKVNYKKVKPSLEDISVAYIKGLAGVPEILKEKLDAILIPYSIFEQMNILIKASGIPVAVLFDNNKNISKLKGTGVAVLLNGIQYEFQKYNAFENLLDKGLSLVSNKDLVTSLIERKIRGINEFILSNIEDIDKSSMARMKDIFNIRTILRMLFDSTPDRKLASITQKALNKIESHFNRYEIIAKACDQYKIIIIFYNNYLYEFLEKIDKVKSDYRKPIFNQINDEAISRLSGLNDPEFITFYNRIIDDRKRFLELVNLYIEDAAFKGRSKEKDLPLLSNAIADRKSQLSLDDIEIDDKEIRNRIFKMKLKRFYKRVSIIILMLLLIFGSYVGYNYYNEYREMLRLEEEKEIERLRLVKQREMEREKIEREKEIERQRIEKQRRWREELIKKYSIHISDRDIYYYADKVAVKNGYDRLDFATIKKKNPDWIYPGNVFILIDGGKVVVKKGDTLWGISEKKLMKISLDFYKIIDKIDEKRKTGKDISRDIRTAKSLAFNKKHIKIIKRMQRK